MIRRLSTAALTLAALAGSAQATWSILLIDTRTGEVALGSATCLTGFDLRANTPVMIVGRGGVTAQSSVDQRGYNRVFARDRLLEGVDPVTIVDLLDDFDNAHQSRQYGIIDTIGGVATFTGANAGQWAGGTTGSFQSFHGGHETTIVYAIQGNVLAGSPVIDEAVDAVINTPGDLAEKMMAGMEAAHIWGGDGRCSCGNDPDGCGSPPNGFDPETDKSAHIAYMLIGRTGDVDSCLSVYRVAPPSYAVGFIDLNGDGLADTVSTGNGGLYRMLNSTPDARFVKLDAAELIGALPGRGEQIETGDVTGDGNDDVVVGVPSDNAIHVFAGDGVGGFDAPVRLATLPGGPAGLALGDLNGNGVHDIVTSTGSLDQVAIFLDDGQGGFDPAILVSVDDDAENVALFDLDADGDLDIAAAQDSIDRLAMVENTGNFAFIGSLGTLDDPYDVVSADLDADGDDDLAVSHRNGRGISVYLQDGGVMLRADVLVSERVVEMDAADADGDGDLDLLAMRLGGSRFTTFENDGAGGFSLVSEDNRLSGGGQDFAATDLTGDGLADAISPGGNAGTSALANLGSSAVGMFPSDLGCASGDYFMTFNIANQTGGDDDPTRQLRGLFDNWRDDLAGRPDAVTSDVTLADELFADGRETTMTVLLMDWQENAITKPTTISVEHAPGSDGRTTIGAITDLGGGAFEVVLGGASETGADAFRITADDGVRPVVLMPDPSLAVVPHPADIDIDGDVDAKDFFGYLDLFAAGDARADIDGDGDIDAEDFFGYLDLFVL